MMDVSSLAELFTSRARLYRLEGEGALTQLFVEGWTARQGLSALDELRIVALSGSSGIDLDELIAQPVRLWTTLADGSQTSRSGVIRQAEMLGGDGGLARYRLTVVPWLWLTTQRRTSRIFENKAVLDIVEHVLQAYAPYAYRLAADVDAYLGGLAPRATTTQYRETDFAFLQRVLAEAGVGWTTLEDEEAAGGHVVQLFADSRELPFDAGAPQGVVRFHRAGSVEASDAIQALVRRRRLSVDRITVLGWDGQKKTAITGEALARPVEGQDAETVGLEYYDVAGHGAFADDAQAQRRAQVMLESAQARAEVFLGRASTRTFRSGTRFQLRDMSALGPRNEAGFEPVFVLDRIEHVGINNLPRETRAAIASRLGGLDAWLTFDEAPPPPGVRDQVLGGVADLESAADELYVASLDLQEGQAQEGERLPHGEVIAAAREVGYCNRFEALRCDRPWRAAHALTQGARSNAAKTASGVHGAIVTGAPEAGASAEPGEILRNHRGDVRIRFHWQESAEGEAASRWARVAQRQAGSGMGMSFVPRIGQEVLVRFVDDDIDQPVVIGAVFNGRGEGAESATPGGKPGKQADDQVFSAARDDNASAQANLSGGHAPAWHGASVAETGHNNAAALSGYKTKEFGGAGYNQAVFDDTDNQLRVQLKSTQTFAELNLGHLVHQAGNFRGNFRGEGAELRTDAYGAVRGGLGVLISTYHPDAEVPPAGEVAGGLALAKQSAALARSLDGAATRNQGVGLATHLGVAQAASSNIDPDKAPLAGLFQTVSGTVSASGFAQAQQDAGQKQSQAGEGRVPHVSDPVILMAGKAGIAQVARRNVQYVSGEAVHWASGEDSNWAVGAGLRIHAGQAAGIVAGLQGAGEGGLGLQMISGTGDILLRAMQDGVGLHSRQALRIASEQSKAEFAAPKRIRIATGGGASIVLEGGNITVMAPGSIDVQSGNKTFTGPESMPYPLPPLPRAPSPTPRELKFRLVLTDTPGSGHGLGNTAWKIARGPQPEGLAWVEDKRLVLQGVSNENGEVELTDEEQKTLATAYSADPSRLWLVYPANVVRIEVTEESDDWDDNDRLLVALDAADFSADRHGTRHADGAPAQIAHAQDKYEATESSEVFAAFKKH